MSQRWTNIISDLKVLDWLPLFSIYHQYVKNVNFFCLFLNLFKILIIYFCMSDMYTRLRKESPNKAVCAMASAPCIETSLFCRHLVSLLTYCCSFPLWSFLIDVLLKYYWKPWICSDKGFHSCFWHVKVRDAIRNAGTLIFLVEVNEFRLQYLNGG